MKTEKILSVILVMLTLTAVLSGCAGNNDSRNVIYEDMQAAFQKANLLSANIGIFSKTEKDGAVSYGECGSGVIFDKRDGAYYALTAAHVVSTENAQILVFSVFSQDAYESMYTAETLYISERDDLAVIRFTADEELPVMEMAEADPAKDDRIMCVGNPENKWFAISYGKVTSGIGLFGEGRGFPSNAMKHTAYIKVGSSGGAAIGEQMKLVGITPGASLTLDGKRFFYGVLIPVSEFQLCLDEWNRQ